METKLTKQQQWILEQFENNKDIKISCKRNNITINSFDYLVSIGLLAVVKERVGSKVYKLA